MAYHLDDNDTPDAYWGHYFEDEAKATRDFDERDGAKSGLDAGDKDLNAYRVEITETLFLAVDCEAESPEEAEDIVRYKYNAGEYVLGAEEFKDLEINAFEKGADD